MPRVVDHDHHHKSRMLWAISAVAAVLVIAVATRFVILKHNLAEQKALQSQMQNPSPTKDAAVASAATQLIDGQRSGKFSFSNQLLAQYYLEGASAYYNLKQYTIAITYYGAAPKYDSTDQTAALEGQAYAGYAAGERRQLIPILEKLETLSANINNPMSPTPGQYQEDISDIQHNQPAENL